MTAAKRYFSFFRIRFAAGLQYRAAALAGVATQLVWGFLRVNMFEAFRRSDPDAFPMTREAMCSYIWLVQAFLTMFMLWQWENDIFDSVTSGSVALELLRPTDLYAMWYARCAASRLAKVCLRCVPVLIAASLLPKSCGLSLPYGANAAERLFTGGLFLLSMIFGFLTVISLSMLVYVSAFHTISPNGTKIFLGMIAEFCAAGEIPLPFFPEPVRRVFEALPFASTASTPFLIYTGTLTGADALRAVVFQLLWCAVLIPAGWLWLRSSLRKVTAQGG